MAVSSLHCDVLVVGAGLAGYCAALEAASCGANVIILEKQSGVGGSTVLSAGMMAFAGTGMQKAARIEDSLQLLFNDLREVGGYVNDERLVKRYVECHLDTFDWLRRLGVEFDGIEIGAGQSLPRSHVVNPAKMIEILNGHARRTGRIELITEAPARRIFRDPGSGRVTEVLAERDERTVQVGARGGVVVASGGFSRSEELIRLFVPSQSGALRFGGEGNTGDGLRMGWALGADLSDVGYVRGTFGVHPMAPPDRHVILLAIYKGAIAVNQEGQRFINESVSYKMIGDACLAQPFGVAYQIFDQDIFDRGVPGNDLYDFARRLAEGFLIRAETLEDLADRIGVQREVLVRTVQEYNESVSAGKDPAFGRQHLVHNFGVLQRIGRPPFYAFPSTSGLVATYGGLRVDDDMAVVDVWGRRIEGLFAAGEVVGGFHGAGYMTGTALGKAAVFGRIAGKNAALRVVSSKPGGGLGTP